MPNNGVAKRWARPAALAQPTRSVGDDLSSTEQAPLYTKAKATAAEPAPLDMNQELVRYMLIALNKPFDVLCQFTDRRVAPTLADYVACPGSMPPGGWITTARACCC